MRVAIESFIFNFLFLCAVITLDIINIESGRATVWQHSQQLISLRK